MEAVPSSAAVDAVVRAANDCVPRRPTTAPPDAAAAAAAAAAADWSGLPEDLLRVIMAALDVPSLIRSGAVCTSWRDVGNTFRLPALKQAPCLLYACEEYGPSEAALYCPSTDATFRVPFPGPPHEKRGFVFSCNGWVFAADEAGNPYLFNPITGVQATLPPVKTILRREKDFYDDEGKHVVEVPPEDKVSRSGVLWARHVEYVRVAISPAAELAACTVLIVHHPDCGLSFARPGDKRWTMLPDDIRCVSDVLYNDKDGLFYIQHSRGSVSTLDLSGPSPSVNMIMGHVVRWSLAQVYLAFTPSGELLQVWRMADHIDTPLKSRLNRQDIRRHVLKDCINFANEDVSNKHIGQGRNENEEDELGEADCDDEQQTDQVSTTELIVFKVDTDRQKLVELRDIAGHALFLGFNATFCLPIKDFSPLEPNCAYLTDDYCSHGLVLRKDLHIWNIKKRSLQNLGDAWPNVHSWLDIPAPIWITPRF